VPVDKPQKKHKNDLALMEYMRVRWSELVQRLRRKKAPSVADAKPPEAVPIDELAHRFLFENVVTLSPSMPFKERMGKAASAGTINKILNLRIQQEKRKQPPDKVSLEAFESMSKVLKLYSQVARQGIISQKDMYSLCDAFNSMNYNASLSELKSHNKNSR